MKTVFNTRQCAHIWAHQTQPSGRNAGRSVHFEGALFYSYRTPIANIVASGLAGVRVALISSETYSQTTASKHLPAAHSAVRGLMLSFQVPFIYEHSCGWYRGPRGAGGGAIHAANLEYLCEAYRNEVARRMRGHCGYTDHVDTHPVDTERGYLDDYASRARDYADTFGLPLPTFPTKEDAEKIVARQVRLANDPKRKAKAALAASQAEERRLARRRMDERANENALLAFRAGERAGNCSDAEGMAMLRVSSDGTEVETSWGARAPVADVRRVLGFYQRVRKTPHAWERLGVSPTTRLGSFTLDGIDTAGNVRAGCHRISAREVESLAAQLADHT